MPISKRIKLLTAVCITVFAAALAWLAAPMATVDTLKPGSQHKRDCTRNMVLLFDIFEEYAAENNGNLPGSAAPRSAKQVSFEWVTEIKPILLRHNYNPDNVLYCPSDTHHKYPSSYRIRQEMYGKSVDLFTASSPLPILEEYSPFHSGARLVLLSSGDVTEHYQ